MYKGLDKSPIQPFGELSFEIEEVKLGNDWDEYFFEHTNFVTEALDPDTYLIVGRRGSGKSSMAEYFSYQSKYSNSFCIEIGKAEEYEPLLFDLAKKLAYSSELATQKLVEFWEYFFWQIIFKYLSEFDASFKQVIDFNTEDNRFGHFFKLLIEGVLKKFLMSTGTELVEYLTRKHIENKIDAFKEKALQYLSKRHLFIVVDSREQYDKNNDHEMWITASLIQCASNFNVRYINKGLHVKVFVSDEIFPYLEEKYITNTSKYIRNTLYLYWRPKDLVRLICWRFYKYLSLNNLINLKEDQINWENYKDIYTKLWVPYFGETLTNRRGFAERTLPYILRHSHLRPRQLIIICNRIAKLAVQEGSFPHFTETIIQQGILDSEYALANELLNSYKDIYTNCGDIIAALEGLPMEFKGSELNKVSHRTASQWDNGRYSPFEFSRLVVEMGIIGRKRGGTDENSKIIKADFEFTMKDRLFVTEKDTCVIHPLFYSKLNINRSNPINYCVYPFPEHPDFDLLQNN